VEEIIVSQFNKERKRVLHLVKSKGSPAETHWTEEPYENVDDETLLKELRVQNLLAAKDKRF